MYNIVHSSTEEADWGLRSLKRKPNWIFCQTAAPAATLFDLIKTSGKFFANHQESLVDLSWAHWLHEIHLKFFYPFIFCYFDRLLLQVVPIRVGWTDFGQSSTSFDVSGLKVGLAAIPWQPCQKLLHFTSIMLLYVTPCCKKHWYKCICSVNLTILQHKTHTEK